MEFSAEKHDAVRDWNLQLIGGERVGQDCLLLILARLVGKLVKKVYVILSVISKGIK